MDQLLAPMETALEQRDESWKRYKIVKKQATTLRGKWLDDLAVARAEAGLESASKGALVMKRREQQRHRARLLKSIMNPSLRSGLSSVKRPKDGRWDNGEWIGTWEDTNDKDGIEDACLEENDRRFHQAEDTDLLHPDVLEILGGTGCTSAATSLLYDGDFGDLLLYLNEASLAYLRECQVPYDIKKRGVFSMDFTTPSYSQGWQRMREQTSCSGQHFGHHIARSYDKELAAMDAALELIPAISGYSPTRWQQGLNVMIPKKEGETRVTHLRTILLYEAAYNQNNKNFFALHDGGSGKIQAFGARTIR